MAGPGPYYARPKQPRKGQTGGTASVLINFVPQNQAGTINRSNAKAKRTKDNQSNVNLLQMDQMIQEKDPIWGVQSLSFRNSWIDTIASIKIAKAAIASRSHRAKADRLSKNAPDLTFETFTVPGVRYVGLGCEKSWLMSGQCYRCDIPRAGEWHASCILPDLECFNFLIQKLLGIWILSLNCYADRLVGAAGESDVHAPSQHYCGFVLCPKDKGIRYSHVFMVLR